MHLQASTHLYANGLNCADNTIRAVDIIQHQIVSKSMDSHSPHVGGKPSVYPTWQIESTAACLTLSIGSSG